MPELFDLWKYNSFVAPLQIAAEEKNVGQCICLFREMLAAMTEPWDMSASPLFCRIAKVSDPKQMLPALLTAMENDSEWDFLQNCDEFKELIAEYKELL